MAIEANVAVPLVKEGLGITNNARDNFITSIVKGVIKELEDEKGIVLDESNDSHLLFVVDYSIWRYKSRDSEGSLPRHLQFRLHNLIIHAPGVV